MTETTREKIEAILGNFDNLAAGHNKIYAFEDPVAAFEQACEDSQVSIDKLLEQVEGLMDFLYPIEAAISAEMAD